MHALRAGSSEKAPEVVCAEPTRRCEHERRMLSRGVIPPHVRSEEVGKGVHVPVVTELAYNYCTCRR